MGLRGAKPAFQLPQSRIKLRFGQRGKPLSSSHDASHWRSMAEDLQSTPSTSHLGCSTLPLLPFVNCRAGVPTGHFLPGTALRRLAQSILRSRRIPVRSGTGCTWPRRARDREETPRAFGGMWVTRALRVAKVGPASWNAARRVNDPPGFAALAPRSLASLGSRSCNP